MTLAPTDLRDADPAAARTVTVERLKALLRSVNGDLDLDRTLHSVCQDLVDGLGFSVAVLNLVLPDGDLGVVACAGSEQARKALLGTRAGRSTWDALLQACRPAGDLLVDYAHVAGEDSSVSLWVPDAPVLDDAGAWHPLDMLLAPLRTPRTGLVGVLSVDLPRDGRRPGPAQLELLELYAAHASIAIENAQLHTALLVEHDERAEVVGRLSSLLDSTPVAIVELDLDGRVRLWNPAAERIFGWPADAVLGRVNPVAPERGYRELLEELAAHPVVARPSRRPRRDGTVIDVEMSASVLRDGEGRPSGYLGVYADTTDRLLLERELRTAAYTDPLTGLANRARFTQRLEEVAATSGSPTVLLLDLDGFKAVNDTAGHAAGDRVLIEVARRIVRACRAGDLVARLGGDEFVVLLDAGPGPARDDAAEGLASRLVEVLAAPVPVGSRTVTLGSSIGVARLRPGDGAGDLLRDADVAMYAAKAQGKGRFTVFERQLRDALVERTDLVADLRRALTRDDELFVRWHPIVRVADARLLGLEALVRWQHPVRGELPPSAFLGLAEDSGLMVDLGRQVLHRACTSLRRWQEVSGGPSTPSIGVNLSPVQVFSDIVRTVSDVLADTGVDPANLVLELTEDVLLQDVESAVEVLGELRRLGLRMAIDDFGAGYSSLAYLKRLPVDVVKLDRSLLVDVETDRAGLALFDAVVGLVRRLGLQAVAEGVETPGQWSLLERLGCPAAQGFLLARPLLGQDVPRLLAVGRPSSGVRPAR